MLMMNELEASHSRHTTLFWGVKAQTFQKFCEISVLKPSWRNAPIPNIISAPSPSFCFVHYPRQWRWRNYPLHNTYCPKHNAYCPKHNAHCTIQIAQSTTPYAHCTMPIAQGILHVQHTRMYKYQPGLQSNVSKNYYELLSIVTKPNQLSNNINYDAPNFYLSKVNL